MGTNKMWGRVFPNQKESSISNVIEFSFLGYNLRTGQKYSSGKKVFNSTQLFIMWGLLKEVLE